MNFTSTLNVVFQVPTVRTERENQIYPKTSMRKFKGSQLISWLSETLVVFKVYQILYHEISQVKKNLPKHFLALQGRVYTHSGQGSDKRALMDFNLSVKA